MLNNIKIAVIYHSSEGHTKTIAQLIADGASSNETEVILMSTKQAIQELHQLNNVQAIIFGSPTYFGSTSADFKTFMDSTSHIWLKQGWHNKIAAAFTSANSASGDQLSTLTQLSIFAAQHGMIWVGQDLMINLPEHNKKPHTYNKLGAWLGYTLNIRDEHGEQIELSEVDINAAIHFGQRVKEITIRFNKNLGVT